MPGFLGRHEFQIDAKGRVSFPSAFRRSVSARPLVLLQWKDTHLDLYPEETWERIQRNLLEHRKAQRDGTYLRTITSSAVEVEPDAHGRIRIPGWLRERADLGRAVLFIGALDRIELWNPARFQQQTACPVGDDDFTAQIFS